MPIVCSQATTSGRLHRPTPLARMPYPTANCKMEQIKHTQGIGMPNRKRTLCAVVVAATFSLEVHAADPAGGARFDRVFPSVYSDLLFNSKTAYEAKRYDEAFPLMQKAACAGDKESQWMLGHMYLL